MLFPVIAGFYPQSNFCNIEIAKDFRAYNIDDIGTTYVWKTGIKMCAHCGSTLRGVA
ncbi:MAG: hypothetical protein LBS50_11555 [Prevotellaceae bacterium]|jgi:hypothetical protein|nr:hypothetical protein [Prevotellaceae bacterium]